MSTQKQLNKSELMVKLGELIEKRTELAAQHKAGQLQNTGEIKQTRRQIADLKRLLASA